MRYIFALFKKFLITGIGIVLFSAALLYGQEKNVDTDSQYWLRLKPSVQLSKYWLLQGEFESRRFMFPDRRSQVILPRVVLYKRFKNDMSLGIGLMHMRHTLPGDNTLDVEEIQPELRPFLDIIMRNAFNRLKVSHRYRLERRFRRNTEGTTLVDGWNSHFRVRYLLQFMHPVIQFKSRPGIELEVSNEVMINIGDDIVRNTFDQNRIYIGFASPVNDKISLELGFMNIFQQQSSGDDFSSKYLIRTTLSYTL